MEPSDRQLLDRYLAGNDETAFRLLVERYLTLVHGVARRVTRSDDLARDVSQGVFLRLASRAALISPGLSLAAWLHRTTHSLAATLVRGEERRKKRERLVAAAGMNANDDPPQTPGWDGLAPVIDRLVDALPGADRELVLARFYRGEPHAVIAARLGLSEALARKRTSRALDKLRAMLGKRGIATTTSALATLLPVHAASTSAPAALAGLILQSAQGITPLVPTGLQVALVAMNTTQKILVAAAAAVFLASLGYAIRPDDAASFSISGVARPSASSDQAFPASSRPRTARNLPSLPATAQGRRERLDQILAIGNALTRRREMLAFTSLLQPDQFADLLLVFDQRDKSRPRALGPDFGSNAERKVLAATWARKDPAGVLSELEARSSSVMVDCNVTLAFALGAGQPAEAVKWAKQIKPESLKDHMLYGLGSVDSPAAAAELLEDVPDERRGSALRWMYEGMADEPGILDRMTSLAKPGAERTALLSQMADGEAQMLPTIAAVELLKSYPDALRQANVEKLFTNLSATDPGGASAALEDLPPGLVRSRALSGVAPSLAWSEGVNAAFALLDRYPGESGDNLVAKVIDWTTKPDGNAMGYLERIQDPKLREDGQLHLLQRWMLKDPQAAQEWVETHQAMLPETVRNRLQSSPNRPTPMLRPVESP